MKKARISIVTAVVVLGFFSGIVLAQDVNEGEIESVKDAKVDFVSYVGPHEVSESIESIIEIGAAMGRAVKAGAKTAGDPAKYSVFHAVDPSEPSKFDADIISIGPGAFVDHIDNLRLILAGFIGAAYGYQDKSSKALAFFVTIYNAVYRSKMDYIGSKYKSIVMSNLEASKAGLARRWDEWAGKTQIIIPLGKAPGSDEVSRVDTGSLTEDEVIEAVREEPDKAIEERQELVDVQEEELEEEREAIEEEREEIEEERTAIEEERERIEEEREAAEEAGDEEALAELTESEAALEEREEALEERETELAEEEAALEEREEDVTGQREEIAEDQEEAIAEDIESKKPVTGIPVLQIIDPLYPYGQIVLVDINGEKIVKKSELNSIRSRTILDPGDGYIVIAGRIETGGAVRLVKLDKKTLDILVTGEDEIFAESILVMNGKEVFAVVKGPDGNWKIGKFDLQLKLAAISEATVNPLTFITFDAAGVIVQDPGGKFVVLNKSDMKTVKSFTP